MYGTTLATVQRRSTTSETNSDEAIEAAKTACTGDDSSTQKCWIGLRYNEGIQPDWLPGYDTQLWAWASGETVLPDEFDWASGEPTTASFPFFEQYCAYLEKSATDQWDDWYCNGERTNNNNLVISAYLCDNPDYQPELECLCNCGCCVAEGDPHITTFDKLFWHFMGQCSYYYVTTCDEDRSIATGIPFVVSLEHYECYQQISGRTCMRATYVYLYDSNEQLAVVVKLGEDFFGMYPSYLYTTV